jgi:hypothetical protein
LGDLIDDCKITCTGVQNKVKWSTTIELDLDKDAVVDQSKGTCVVVLPSANREPGFSSCGRAQKSTRQQDERKGCTPVSPPEIHVRFISPM